MPFNALGQQADGKALLTSSQDDIDALYILTSRPAITTMPQ